MENLDNIKYELLNYSKYRKRLQEVVINDKLIELGVKRSSLGKTSYGYDIDCITIGNGDKHLFIVGGTHGSEIIGVDFVTQLIDEIGNFNNFDPSEFKLFIIPNQNPEGFMVTTDSLMKSDVCYDFEGNSKEYYFRYKFDNIISSFIKDFNNLIMSLKDIDVFVSADSFLVLLKDFFSNNKWLNLLSNKNNGIVPELRELIAKINNLDEVNDFEELRLNLVGICNELIEREISNGRSEYFALVVEIFRNYFNNNEVWDTINNSNIAKLHQVMFKNVGFDGIKDVNLRSGIENMYKEYNHSLGSQVTYDATGLGVNLNANNRTNPGIKVIEDGRIVMGGGARNNLRNYVPGPLGVPTVDISNFSYTNENKALYKLIKSSYDSGNYCGTILYHGTGGLIFYKPYQELMEEGDYKYFEQYNNEMACCYEKATGYRLISGSDNTGYGDLLRRTFPGVLLVELSKMGGNPIAPYGDKNNIYNTFKANYKALDDLLGYFKKKYNFGDIKIFKR